MRLSCNVLLCLCVVLQGTGVPAQDCGKLNRRLSSLSSDKKRLLKQYSVVRDEGTLLIGSEVSSNCSFRLAVADFIWHGIVENLTDTDRRFADQHRALVNKAVRRIWPLIADSPAIPSDGNLASEKWNLLRNPVLDDATVTELVSAQIGHEGLWGDSAYLLLSRPLPNLVSQVRAVFHAKSSSSVEKLYALAVLSRISHSNPLPLLQRIATEAQLTAIEQNTVTKLRARFSAGQPAEWSDVQNLIDKEL